MDNASAYLMEDDAEPHNTSTIESKFTHGDKEHSLGKSENLMHNKEQHLAAAYYKQIGEHIKNYDSVVLFGPTNARLELFNFLRADHAFDNIKIETVAADKMSENQKHAFVRNYFAALPKSHSL